MRFNTPQEVIQWADMVAASDYARHTLVHTDSDGTTWQIDKNPYCTTSARNSWQRGFDNVPPYSWEGSLDFDTQYQRGAAMARLIKQQD